MKRALLFSLLILVGLILLVVQFYLVPRLPVINGYAAHMACSCFYLSDRSLEITQKEDLHFFPLNYVRLLHDDESRSVRSTFFGMGQKTAVYKDGLGCMLLKGEDDYQVSDQIDQSMISSESQVNQLPYTKKGKPLSTESLSQSKLSNAFELAFDEAGTFTKKTRAMVVVHRDTLVGAHYAEGIDSQTPLLGWSMTKSVTNALIGILLKDSLLDLNQKYKEDSWRDSVRLHDLLQMNSGIAWEEVYDQVTDATQMLYDSELSAGPMMLNETAHEPGEHWVYSSGTTNYLSKIIKEVLASDHRYQNFPYERLAKPIGANSFIMEMDESGHYIMSSYGYATAVDWAKFGLLYLHDGLWNGERILPEDWVHYSTTVNKASEDGQYGAQIWLNTNHNYFDHAPSDTYFFSGFQGQKVIVIPSKDLVVVRLGLGDDPGFDMDGVLKLILNEVD